MGKALRDDHGEFPGEEMPDHCHTDKSDHFGVINSFSTHHLSVYYSPDITLGVWIQWRVKQIIFCIKYIA